MTFVQASLPKPTAIEIEHSLALIAHLKAILARNGGKMSLMQYVAEVLYAKGLGYYASGTHKIGAGGDFITAPCLTPAFSYCVADYTAAVLAQLAQPVVLEIGAGTGEMAAHVLLALARCRALPDVYYILETSPDLKARQHKTIARLCPQHLSRVTWLDQPLQSAFNGVILANELLDALPVFRFKKVANEVVEMGVAMTDGRFSEVVYAKQNRWLQDAVARIEENVGTLPEGYCSEVNLTLKPWLETITQSLAAGVCLFIDYGYTQKQYYDPARSHGTLSCYYKHLTHADPFVYPGLQDITTHVDFTHLAQCADELGLNALGFATQNQWLLALGIYDHAKTVAPFGVDANVTQQALQTLLSPSAMGESFKVMALARGIDQPLPGFGDNNQLFLL